MVVISLIAGPSFIPITEVRCVSVSFGKQDPSIRFSVKSWNEVKVKAYSLKFRKANLYQVTFAYCPQSLTPATKCATSWTDQSIMGLEAETGLNTGDTGDWDSSFSFFILSLKSSGSSFWRFILSRRPGRALLFSDTCERNGFMSAKLLIGAALKDWWWAARMGRRSWPMEAGDTGGSPEARPWSLYLAARHRM